MTEIWLAAPDETVSLEEATEFDHHPLTIKLGGSPAWLLPEDVSTPPDTSCSRCNAAMVLVAQVHAPLSNVDARVLYLFACRSGKCKTSWKAFRAQASTSHKTYAIDDPQATGDSESTFAAEDFADVEDKLVSASEPTFEGDEFDDVVEDAPVPAVTTIANPSSTSAVAQTPVFDEGSFGVEGEEEDELPQLDPNVVLEDFHAHSDPHPAHTSGSALASSSTLARDAIPTDSTLRSLGPYIPICLDVFPEPMDANRAEQKELQKLRKQVKNIALDDAPGDEYEGKEDKAFSRFSKRLAKYPKQCIRWCPRGQPLPIQLRNPPPGSDLPGSSRPPVCPSCGGPRQHELQLLPTTLYYLETYWHSWLHPGSVPPDCGLSFGGIHVYTCTAHCGPGRYQPEHVHYQEEV